MRMDAGGNLWLIDASGHIVYKLTREGKELMHLGTKGVKGGDEKTFNLPTDIAFAANGDIYVSDGYGAARIVKFTKDGKFIRQWGTRGNGPGQFGCPHSIGVDAQGKVYVNDRDNQRVEVFDSDGKFLTEWASGNFNEMNITKDQKIWTGGVLRELDGTVIGTLPDVPNHGMTAAANGDVYFSKGGGVVLKFVKQ
jgi:DNA-binding beta-propeller fold protein YncE